MPFVMIDGGRIWLGGSGEWTVGTKRHRSNLVSYLVSYTLIAHDIK